ncbi:hypothetical protein HYW68_02420 [Candidatus Parcubacteria bacterium]|nr:hypothetical protein [Candidatus Parcubacteria bacterium]
MAMVSLSLNSARQLAQGYQSFDFRAVGDCKISGMRCGGDLEQKYRQRLYVGEVQARLLALDMLACDAFIEVKVAQGTAACSGAVCAFDPESHRIAGMVLEGFQSFVEGFAHEHPQLEFSLTYSQNATITSVV